MKVSLPPEDLLPAVARAFVTARFRNVRTRSQMVMGRKNWPWGAWARASVQAADAGGSWVQVQAGILTQIGDGYNPSMRLVSRIVFALVAELDPDNPYLQQRLRHQSPSLGS
jgi:hypothetical protein